MAPKENGEKDEQLRDKGTEVTVPKDSTGTEEGKEKLPAGKKGE